MSLLSLISGINIIYCRLLTTLAKDDKRIQNAFVEINKIAMMREVKEQVIRPVALKINEKLSFKLRNAITDKLNTVYRF